MSKSVNVRYLLQRVIAAALILLALWILYSKLAINHGILKIDSVVGKFLVPGISRRSQFLKFDKKSEKYSDGSK